MYGSVAFSLVFSCVSDQEFVLGSQLGFPWHLCGILPSGCEDPQYGTSLPICRVSWGSTSISVCVDLRMLTVWYRLCAGYQTCSSNILFKFSKSGEKSKLEPQWKTRISVYPFFPLCHLNSEKVHIIRCKSYVNVVDMQSDVCECCIYCICRFVHLHFFFSDETIKVIFMYVLCILFCNLYKCDVMLSLPSLGCSVLFPHLVGNKYVIKSKQFACKVDF